MLVANLFRSSFLLEIFLGFFFRMIIRLDIWVKTKGGKVIFNLNELQ